MSNGAFRMCVKDLRSVSDNSVSLIFSFLLMCLVSFSSIPSLWCISLVSFVSPLLLYLAFPCCFFLFSSSFLIHFQLLEIGSNLHKDLTQGGASEKKSQQNKLPF